MNRFISSKIWSAALLVSGGVTACGGFKLLNSAYKRSEDRKISDVLPKLDVLGNRFMASCATRVGYGNDGKVTPDDIMLYWASGSPYAWRIMITLEEKGLSGYKNKLLTMSEKEHKTPEILAINPRGQVPTFKHGGVIINESLAACEFLESIYNNQGTCLMPSDPGAKATVLQKYHEGACLGKKGLEDLTFYLFGKNTDPEVVKTRKDNFLKELQLWEDFLSKSEQPYLCGKNFTLADVSVFPLLALMVRLGLQLQPRFPRLAEYYKVVSERPSVKASWPPHWSGPPKSNILSDLY